MVFVLVLFAVVGADKATLAQRLIAKAGSKIALIKSPFQVKFAKFLCVKAEIVVKKWHKVKGKS